MDLKKKNKLLKKLLIVGIMLQILVLGLTMYMTTSKGVGGGAHNDNDFNFVVFVPIWIAIMTPFMVSKNKSLSEERKYRKLLILAALAGLVLAVMLVFLIKII
jgi:cation transport ATPase